MVISDKRRDTLASLVGVQKRIGVHHVLLYTSGVVAAPLNDQTVADHALLV